MGGSDSLGVWGKLETSGETAIEGVACFPLDSHFCCLCVSDCQSSRGDGTVSIIPKSKYEISQISEFWISLDTCWLIKYLRWCPLDKICVQISGKILRRPCLKNDALQCINDWWSFSFCLSGLDVETFLPSIAIVEWVSLQLTDQSPWPKFVRQKMGCRLSFFFVANLEQSVLGSSLRYKWSFMWLSL